MASGCAKADRNRRSPNNAAYKAGNRQAVNAKRKQARHARTKGKLLAVPRGSARKDRRIACLTSNGELTPEIWHIYRRMELRAAALK